MKIVIPARYASSRLPGKPLMDIAGKPMVQHVWERAIAAVTDPMDVFVAADDTRILKAVEAFGGQAVATRDDHVSGTDRIAEVAEKLGWADDMVVVNVQGDEPLVPPALIELVGSSLGRHPAAAMATASHTITDMGDITNPNVVKVVTDNAGFAAYFSRAAIPYNRDHDISDLRCFPYQRHIGIYAYRVATLKALTQLAPAPTEVLESLEQLRALWYGMKIMVEMVTDAPPAGVDTPEDLALVRRLLGHAQ